MVQQSHYWIDKSAYLFSLEGLHQMSLCAHNSNKWSIQFSIDVRFSLYSNVYQNLN